MTSEERLDALLSAHISATEPDWTSANGYNDGYDGELAPLLAAAARLDSLRTAQPAPAFASALEARLLARAASVAAQSAPTLPLLAASAVREESDAPPVAAHTLPTNIRSRPMQPHGSHGARGRSSFRRALWPAVAAAVLLLALGGLLGMAASAAPGSALYGLHRLEQNARAALTTDPADRFQLHLTYAEDALGQLTLAAHHGDTAAYSQALATLRTETQAAGNELADLPSGSERDRLSGQLSGFEQRARQSMRAILPIVGWTQRLQSTSALAQFGDTVPQVASVTIVRAHDDTTHPIHVIVTGSGFAPGAVLLVNGQPAGTVLANNGSRLLAALPSNALAATLRAAGVGNPDGTAAESTAITGNGGNTGMPATPTVAPGNSGGHTGGHGKGGHGAGPAGS